MFEINNLTKKYRDNNGNILVALDNVSLSLSTTGLVFIVGDNGSGKSTLLKLISGITNPENGNIIYNGQNIFEFSNKELENYLANELSIVFQNNNLIEDLSIKSNINLPKIITSKEEDNLNLIEYIEIFEISKHNNKKINKLSGGEKQKIALIRELSKDSKVFILDEATSSVDKESADQIYHVLKNLSSDKLVLAVTHDLDVANKYADRIIKLQKGKIVDDIIVDSKKLKFSKINYILDSNKKITPKNIVNLGFQMFFSKKRRFFFTSILSVFSILILSVFLILFNFDKNTYIKKYINKSNSKYIILEKNEISGKYSFDVEDIDYISKELSESIVWKSYSSYNTNNSIDRKEEIDSIINYDYKGFLSIDNINLNDFGLNIIAGEKPNSNNELMISSFTLDGFMKFGYIDSKGKNYQINTPDEILDKEIIVGYKTYKITGVIDTGIDYLDIKNMLDKNSNNNSYVATITSEPFLNYLFVSSVKSFSNETDLVIENLIINISNKKSTIDLVKFLDIEKNYVTIAGIIGHNIWNHNYSIRSFIPYYKLIFISIIIVVLIVSYLTSTDNINLRINDIYIFRIQGMRKFDNLRIFLIDSLITNILVTSLGLIIVSLILKYYNFKLENNIFLALSTYQLNFSFIIYIFLINIFSSTIFILINFYLNYNKISNRKVYK